MVLKNTGGWVGEREVKLQALILDVGGAEVLDDDLPAHFLKPRLDGLADFSLIGAYHAAFVVPPNSISP